MRRRSLSPVRTSHPIGRPLAGALTALAAMALAACGSTTTGGSTPAPSASPTPIPPAGAQFTETGDITLVTTVAPSSITCSFPSLLGPEITMLVGTVDQKMGGFITLTSTQVLVRIGAGSGPTYTQRNFAGPGVTGFNATRGASFNAQLTDVSPAGQNKGTIGSLTSVAGSVSCGTKTPGSGTISINGNSTGGAISGDLTSILVKCTAGANFALINGLTHIGTTPAAVEIGGGSGETYFASFQTGGSGGFFFSSMSPGLYSVTDGHVHWSNAVLTQSGTAGAAGHTVTVTGDATCGTQ